MTKELNRSGHDVTIATSKSEHDTLDSFEELCTRYRSIVRSIIEARMDAKLCQRIDPSDIVQEAFLEAFSRLEDFRRRNPMPLVSWLRETAIQQLKIAERRHRIAGKRSILRQVSYEQSSIFKLAEQMTAVVATAQDRHESTEESQRTWLALSKLSEGDREILLLRYMNGLSNVQAAEIIGVSETVASKRHCRALFRLQAQLGLH